MPAYQPLVNPHEQFLDNNGKPLANGKVYTYLAGTTTKAATYEDSAGSASNSNPVILDSAGFATIYLDTSKSYKIVVQDAYGVPQWTADNVTGGVPTGGGISGYPGIGIAVSTGTGWDTSFNPSHTIPASYVSVLNQNTTGTAAGITSNGTANQVWSMNATATAQGWQTVTAGGGMVWPPTGTAGIPNYNGSSAWGTSYSSANPIPSNFIGRQVVTKTANYTTAVLDDVVLMNSASATTVTLTTTGIVSGKLYRVKNLSTGAVTVQGATGNIDGAANVTLAAQYQSMDFVFDGTNLWIM